jgi:hypothetical protein
MIVLCGNKNDLEVERKVSLDEADKFSVKNKIINFEVSAKTGDNMARMIYYTVARLPFFEQFGVGTAEIVRELGKFFDLL